MLNNKFILALGLLTLFGFDSKAVIITKQREFDLSGR